MVCLGTVTVTRVNGSVALRHTVTVIVEPPPLSQALFFVERVSGSATESPSLESVLGGPPSQTSATLSFFLSLVSFNVSLVKFLVCLQVPIL